MNYELTNKIIKWMEHSEEFLGNQIPSFVEEMCRWGFFHHILVATLCVGVGLFCWFVIARCRSSLQDNPSGDSFFETLFIGVGLVTILISFIYFCDNISQAIKSKMAPRAYVVDQLKKR